MWSVFESSQSVFYCVFGHPVSCAEVGAAAAGQSCSLRAGPRPPKAVRWLHRAAGPCAPCADDKEDAAGCAAGAAGEAAQSH